MRCAGAAHDINSHTIYAAIFFTHSSFLSHGVAPISNSHCVWSWVQVGWVTSPSQTPNPFFFFFWFSPLQGSPQWVIFLNHTLSSLQLPPYTLSAYLFFKLFLSFFPFLLFNILLQIYPLSLLSTSFSLASLSSSCSTCAVPRLHIVGWKMYNNSLWHLDDNY